LIDIYPGFVNNRYVKTKAFFNSLSELIGSDVIPFSCARAAMVYGLRALGLKRMDEVLVPPYLGHCVLSALGKAAFPTMTASCHTKGILVFHQFGYPQRVNFIDEVAKRNDWIIINDCANSIFSYYEGERIIGWGDFSVLSFSKIYPCILGGALISSRTDIYNTVNADHNSLSRKHREYVDMAYKILEKAKRNLLGEEVDFEVDAAYGYLPELVSFPSKSLTSLPDSVQEIETDTNHRRKLLSIISSYFPDRVPECSECDVVPFAVPISGEIAQLEQISYKIKQTMGVNVPVLHFDFSRNMLSPDYKKAMVIGCHSEWTEELVTAICETISKG